MRNQTIRANRHILTEPSAVAPDARVNLGNIRKNSTVTENSCAGNLLRTHVDSSIRRYRARFCSDLLTRNQLTPLLIDEWGIVVLLVTGGHVVSRTSANDYVLARG
jgi:hypothetical protein